jgi:hypothetical protein
MRFFPKGLNPFKIQTRFKLDLLSNFVIQNPEGIIMQCLKFFEFRKVVFCNLKPGAFQLNWKVLWILGRENWARSACTMQMAIPTACGATTVPPTTTTVPLRHRPCRSPRPLIPSARIHLEATPFSPLRCVSPVCYDLLCSSRCTSRR